MQNRAALIFVLITVTLDSIGIGLIFPVMPQLIEEVTGGDLSQAAVWGGVLATSFAVMQFLFGPVVGNLSDRYGRRPVMLTALAVMAADYLVMALAGSVWLLLAGRLLAGITAATHSTAAAYVADISAPEDRGRNFGLIGAGFGMGFILGPLIGGLLAALDTRAPFYGAALMAAANLALGLAVLPETVTDRIRRPFRWSRANPLGAFRAAGKLPGLTRLMAVFLLLSVAGYVYPAIWAYYGRTRFGWGAGTVGLSLALYGGAMMAVQALLVGPAIRRIGEARAASAGMAVDLVSALFYGVVTSPVAALAFTPFAALGGLSTPALQALASRAAPDDAQGELQGVLASLSAVSMILSPLIMTATFSAFTRPGAAVYAPGAPFLLAAVLLVVCILLHVAGPRVAAPEKDLA
ncbi:MFS transporter [Acidimangrovimonas pyrenivorans]|uniref:MFS transporter n=1 Tax=Acidimangrovimonas pyrenivorans TaxID=2030798 RepID=A0ABV7ALQ0_9RHOB